MPRLLKFLFRYIFGIVSCIYLFTLGLLRGRNRALITTITAHFGYGVNPTKMPVVPLSALAPNTALISVDEPAAQDGNISTFELVAIIKLIKEHHPHRLFELGTFDGRTTLNMTANAAANAEVFTLDLPQSKVDASQLRLEISDRKYIDKAISGAKYHGTAYEPRITQLYGDSAAYDFSPFFSTVDFVFVDAAHSYEYVCNDSKIALRLLHGGKGVILWHDYGAWPGVTQALDYLRKTTPEFRGLQHIEGTTLACLVAD